MLHVPLAQQIERVVSTDKVEGANPSGDTKMAYCDLSTIIDTLKEKAVPKNINQSFKVLPIFISGYTYDIGRTTSCVELNIRASADIEEFRRNTVPVGYTDCCLIFGSDAKYIRQRLLDTEIAQEYKKVADNFEDREKLNKEVKKLKETLASLDKKKKYYEQIEADNQALKHQNDLIKRENDEIKERLSKYDTNPIEGTTRFNLIEVD